MVEWGLFDLVSVGRREKSGGRAARCPINEFGALHSWNQGGQGTAGDLVLALTSFLGPGPC